MKRLNGQVSNEVHEQISRIAKETGASFNATVTALLNKCFWYEEAYVPLVNQLLLDAQLEDKENEDETKSKK